MAISRKPQATEKKTKEADVAALINKGGTAAKNEPDKAKEKSVLVRVPGNVLERIDSIVNSKTIKTPRHTWLLEAIYEKLEREG